MEGQARIAAKVEHARAVEGVMQWLGWSVAVLGVSGVVTFALLWAFGELNAEQGISLILGTALTAILSGATAYGSGVNVGLGAERLEIAARGSSGPPARFAGTDIGVTSPYWRQAAKAADVLDQTEADTVHKFQGRQKQVVILTTVLDETWRGRTGLPFVDDPQMINVAVSRAIQRFILVTKYDMLPNSRHIRDLVGYIRYHNPGEDVVDSMVVSVFDLLYRAYSQRLRSLAARLRKELKYPSEDIIWTVLHDIIAEQRYAHMTVSSQVLLRNLLGDLSRLTLAQRAYVQHRASVDFVVYNQVTNQPLLAIEVDGFAFHENSPDQRARDALKDEIMGAHQMPLLRLPTTGSREHQQIRQALDNAEAHWARLSTR